jgi:citrate synthase
VEEKHGLIGPREETFRTKIRTSITKEVPSEENPFVAKEISWCGIPLTNLLSERSFSEVIFLLLRGRLPTARQQTLFDRFLVAMANPGPRHPATRAAMTAAAGKTKSPHVLPIGLSVLGGEYGGALEVETAMRFMRKNSRTDPKKLVDEICKTAAREIQVRERVAPGFGTLYGAIDPMSLEILNGMHSVSLGEGPIDWALRFAQSLSRESAGIVVTGVAAAVLLELGFHPRVGVGLFQLASAPGLLAHSQELATKHYTEFPMVADEDYEYREDEND